MSDTGTRLNLRDLPPVDPIDKPSRLSMTLLRTYQACNRAGYLYLKHGGGAPAHNMDFGTALHLFAERVLTDLIRQGEKSLYATAEGEGVSTAQQQVASLTAAIVDEVLREHPELVVPVSPTTDAAGNVLRATQDDLREAAYHFAVGSDIDPEQIIGLERKLTLELESGLTLVGKPDVLLELTPGELAVDDLKSSFALPTEAEFERRFQLQVYALLAVFGHPVETVDGVERQLPAIGHGVQRVRGRELYPRMRLRDDGRVQHRETWFTRQQLADFRWDIERLGYELLDAFGSWKFPAVPGSHCSQCSCPAECPLPTELRSGAGSVESAEEALEVLAWADRTGRAVSAAKREVRRFMDESGVRLVLGDKVWALVPETSTELDRHGLVAAAREAAEHGVELRVEDFERERVSMRFKPLKKDEAAALLDGMTTTEEVADGSRDGEAGRDARYGETAPF